MFCENFSRGCGWIWMSPFSSLLIPVNPVTVARLDNRSWCLCLPNAGERRTALGVRRWVFATIHWDCCGQPQFLTVCRDRVEKRRYFGPLWMGANGKELVRAWELHSWLPVGLPRPWVENMPGHSGSFAKRDTGYGEKARPALRMVHTG